MKILIRGTNWIGDAVMTIPAMRQLNRLFPDAHLTLYTRSWAEGIFRDADFVDEIITFDNTPRRLQRFRDEIALIKREKFDLAVIFPNSFESALTAFSARIPRRIGFNKDLRGLLLTDPIAVPEWKGRTHEVYYYLELVREAEQRILGAQTTGQFDPDVTLAVSEERKSAARQLLEGRGVLPEGPTVALGAGSTNSRAKRWPAERFAELSDRLSEAGFNVVLVGAANETDVSHKVAHAARTPPIDITGVTDLAEAAAVLSVVDLFICNDMGLAHIAAACGTPTVVIFGPTNHLTTRPFGDTAVVVRHDVECSPCMLRDCPIDHRCMTRIEVDKVFDAAISHLNRASPIIIGE